MKVWWLCLDLAEFVLLVSLFHRDGILWSCAGDSTEYVPGAYDLSLVLASESIKKVVLENRQCHWDIKIMCGISAHQSCTSFAEQIGTCRLTTMCSGVATTLHEF